ncbi:MAG: EAL domain-containing protein [Solirubrobacteraceae bacterium]|jgi:diguanylate cyclase (GGDEF)-like protein
MEGHATQQPPAGLRRLRTAVQCLLIAAAATAAALTSGLDHWRLLPLAVIATFTIVSDLTAVRPASVTFWISGSFLGVVLAAVLLGGGPAALLGVATISIGWLHSREAAEHFRNNLLTFAWFPLVAGRLFAEVTSIAHVGPRTAAYYLFVFAAFVVALMLNFAGVATHQRLTRRWSVVQQAREMLIPVLPAELFSALLTLVAVYIAVHLRTPGLVLFGLVVIIFQYLVGELLTSKRRSELLQRVATTDELTGLANRERFGDAVQERITVARATEAGFSVLLMDLDRFKEINDTLGHHYGDLLLSDLGPRLVEAIGEGGLVARLGGDEFGILLAEEADDPAVLDAALTRLLRCVSSPFAFDELALEVGASVGVARFPTDGEDSHALLRCADVAMYAAKDAQTDFKIYSAEQNQHSMRRLSVLSDIRHALASDQIVVHFQPIVDVGKRTVRGAEGLVRWEHPHHGLIGPGAFVATVEQTGLIGPLTRHVLERSISECARWRRDGRDLSVAVNLSVRNLLDRDLPKRIERLLTTYALPADALQLEITESMLMSDPDRALATVGRLSELGVHLSVDDFGTGYSSLANLRKMPINELKIDRSFVSPMLRDESDLIIVRSTINLGHDLGLKIIAEGVEDGATLDHLAVLGCDLAQGYHLSRPLPADSFRAWLSQPPSAPAARVAPLPGAPARATSVAVAGAGR